MPKDKIIKPIKGASFDDLVKSAVKNRLKKKRKKKENKNKSV